MPESSMALTTEPHATPNRAAAPSRHRRTPLPDDPRAALIVARQQRDLERAREDFEQFAYIVSHDLQEPLRMVSSYLQLLERRYKDKLDSDAEDFIHFAVDGAQRMQKLISDLVNYSRLNTRASEFAPTDLNAVLERALASSSEAAIDCDACITHEPLPTLIADAAQVQQLLEQLIDNALKFRNGGRPTVHVGAEQRDGEWVFFVRDNGIGVSPEYSDRIFGIFQRLHSRSAYPGTGMGLAICKRIVERRGGRLWVESTPGSGSTFYFTMPQRAEDRA
jgi:light-regulated signal transduction histidine kinase (bacteriophytochrome)